ncbi:MAG: response regulator, partial [Magnetococcales bacterium]|nr:response regulator [Magnetococcales bacterium]
MPESNTLLIVEDSSVQRAVLQRLLKKSGYTLVLAKNGEEGLALTRACAPSLVISDITMPKMDGYTMCREIKQDAKLCHIPVLLLTSLDDPREVIHGLEAGADGYLTKPVDDPFLLEQIRSLLALSDADHGPGSPNGMAVTFAGETYLIQAGRRQTMNLLLSTYENAVRKNRELLHSQAIIREKDALLIQTTQAASRAKSDFIASLSHEIRTPMNAIMGFIELAMRSEPNDSTRNYLEKVEKASHALMGCLNDILDFSKIEAGKLELYPVPFNPFDLFDNLADMFGDQAADKGLELVFSIPPGYFPALVGDAKRLQQVFTNLLRNAIKFTDQGTVIVTAHPSTITVGPVKVQFSVKDTGIGIDSERINALFNPFAQADPSIAIRYGGSGLGLNICKQLVEMMGGHVWVESTLGQGSTFHFDVLLNCPNASRINLIVPAYLREMRILVVDDHELTRAIMEEMLRGFELFVQSVDSGESALAELLRANAVGRPFDLVFMDWRMPGMDGIETTVAVRTKLALATPRATLPKIVMLTAFGKNTIQHFAKSAGVDLFLHKPVSRVHLFNTILEVFGAGVPKKDRLEQVLAEESMVANKIGGARILLVEDNSINQQVAQALLERVGIVVEIANNGREALCRLNESAPFDLVLMDIQMPEMDGYAATTQLRCDARFTQVPVIAMTAHVLHSVREKCLAVGMNDHITKPIHIQQLYSILIKWLNPDDRKHRFGQTARISSGLSAAPAAHATRGSGDEAAKDVQQPMQTLADPSHVDAMEHPVESGSVLPPHLDGIDLAVAMERFRGQQPFFRRMLLGFMRYATTVDEVRQALDQEDMATAQDLVHTMKGMAGNLAATDLYHAAHAVEESMESGHIQEEPNLLIVFEAELKRVIETVRTLNIVHSPVPTEATEPGNASATPISLEAQLRELAHCLRTQDTDAELGVAALKQTLTQSHCREALQRMEAQLYRLDYRGGVRWLVEIRRRRAPDT